MSLPYFAPNGAIVLEQVGRCYRVSVKEFGQAVTVDTDVTFNGKFIVSLPPLWRCTDEERAEVTDLARAAVESYLASVRKGVNCASASQ